MVGKMTLCVIMTNERGAYALTLLCLHNHVKERHNNQLLLRRRRRGGDLLPRPRRPADTLRFLAGDLLLRDDCLDRRGGLLRELRRGDLLRRLW